MAVSADDKQAADIEAVPLNIFYGFYESITGAFLMVLFKRFIFQKCHHKLRS
jgi:hypothetical protein